MTKDHEILLDVYSLLKHVGSLEAAGFNDGRLQHLPRGTKDESGVTAGQYRRCARAMQRRISRMKRRLGKMLNQ